MTIAFWCVLVACIIPIALAWVGAWFRYRQLGRVDNKHPRGQYGELSGPGARAVAAQQNAWEALPIFAAAVVIAHLAGLEQGTANLLALLFIAARLLHAVFYISNLDLLRSVTFAVGLASCIALFVMAA